MDILQRTTYHWSASPNRSSHILSEEVKGFSAAGGPIENRLGVGNSPPHVNVAGGWKDARTPNRGKGFVLSDWKRNWINDRHFFPLICLESFPAASPLAIL
jgi:hypothetical protein